MTASQTIARIGLGGALVFAGIGHLTFARDDFRAQVPRWVPLSEDATVLASGVVEIVLGAAIASGIAHKRVGRFAAAFFVAVFPGNLSQWRNHRDAFGLDSDLKRLLRLPMQVPLIAVALWSTGALDD
ncbi:DoxX family protein [Naasia lichenicola]|nr:DoxX family membrane protein [Naasia lichenicola]